MPNKARLKKAAEVFAEQGIHPLKEAMTALLGVEEYKDRAQLWLKMYEWCEAKPKAQEELPGDLDPDEFAHVSSDELLKLVKPDGAT